MWNQPWRPMFCDWEVTLELGPLTGWELGATDTDPTTDPDVPPVATPDSVTCTGRSPLVNGVSRTIAAGIGTWLTAGTATQRRRARRSDAPSRRWPSLQQQLAELDLLSVALDGVREQLLGLAYDRGLLHKDADNADDGTRRALVDGVAPTARRRSCALDVGAPGRRVRAHARPSGRRRARPDPRRRRRPGDHAPATPAHRAGALAVRSRRRDLHLTRRGDRVRRPIRPHEAGEPRRRIPAARPHG